MTTIKQPVRSAKQGVPVRGMPQPGARTHQRADPAKDDSMRKIARQQIDSDIEQVHKGLFEDGLPHGTLPLALFERHFLEFFAGKVKDDPKLNLTTTWISIAGSPMNPVDVIGDDGKVVYTVPAMWTSDFVNPTQRYSGKSFSQIAQDASYQANRIPVLGDRVFEAAGVAKVKTMQPAPHSTEQRQWQQIWNRYNIEIPKIPGQPGKEVVATPSNGSDKLIFDDE